MTVLTEGRLMSLVMPVALVEQWKYESALANSLLN
jgi:hypothetical protein